MGGVKKMPNFQKSVLYSNTTVNFLPAELKRTKSSGWQLIYYAKNPQSEKLERVRLKLNRAISRYRTKREAMPYAIEVVNSLNLKLSGGWSPFFEVENARLYEKKAIYMGDITKIMHSFIISHFLQSARNLQESKSRAKMKS